jgi:IS30 family transposase
MATREEVQMLPSEHEAVWQQYRAGATCPMISRALGKHVSTIYSIVSSNGGITPARSRRDARSLTAVERETISRGVSAGESVRAMARDLGRAPSTISREIARNGGRRHYRALNAETQAWQRARRPKSSRFAQSPMLRAAVHAKLRVNWSPEQISGWLRREYPEVSDMHVSHETIYRSLFIQTRGALKRELTKHLRTRRQMRRSQRAGQPIESRIVDAVSIALRPPSVEDRAIPGHWEGDLVSGSKQSHIATLVERKSRYVHLVQVNGKDTGSVVNALIREVQRLPAGLMASLTWDRGMELAQHARFTVATDAAVYFCDPHSPWQRGTNENTNGLLRQYFPDGTDLSIFDQQALDAVALQLNTRPRKTLDFLTPAHILAGGVARTG